MWDEPHAGMNSGNAGCRQFEADLANYLEGEEQPRLEAHARDCAYCAAVLADLKQITSLAHEVFDQEPPARLWANVRASLVAEGLIRPAQPGLWQRFFQPHWALSPVAAAAMACLVVVGMWMVGRHPTPVPLGTAVSQAGMVPTIESPSVALALRDMERQFDSATGRLDPTLEASYRKGLDSLDGEIRECQAFVNTNPNDTMAREYLNMAVAEKARVLQSALESVGR